MKKAYDEKLSLVNEFKKTKNNHEGVRQNYQIISPFTFNFLGSLVIFVCERLRFFPPLVLCNYFNIF